MLETDVKNERILKEFIDGDTIYQLVLEDKMKTGYIEQLHKMCALLYAANTNIDYFPSEARQHGSILMNSTSCLIRSILQNICSSSGRK